MKKFANDTQVCHPLYGLGKVEKVEEKTVLGERISLAQIVFPHENLKMMVNIDKSTELFRPVIGEDQVPEIFDYLESHEGEVPSRANQRQRVNLEKIKSNDIFQLCEVIKCLAVISSKKKLSFREGEMYERARRVLLEELALVTGRDEESLSERLQEACLGVSQN